MYHEIHPPISFDFMTERAERPFVQRACVLLINEQTFFRFDLKKMKPNF